MGYNNIEPLRLTPEIQRQISEKSRLEREAKSRGLHNVNTEARASQLLRDFFASTSWEYREQYLTKNNGVIDFVVKAPHQDGYIFFGVECKRQLCNETNATELADHMEQAQAYSKNLNMPIFLGPVLTPDMGSSLWLGGHKMSSIAALNIFGGRVNVGTIIRTQRDEYVTPRWCMVLRGDYFLAYDGRFNSARINMVSTTNSKKQREPMKIWQPRAKPEEWKMDE